MIILIDNCHGSDTESKGKFSPILDESISIDKMFVNGNRFREWKYNRIIAKDVVEVLKSMGYDARLLVPEETDISLKERVKRINSVCDKVGASNVLMISVHSNAAGNGSTWAKAFGWSCYTTVGTTISDALAEFLYKRAEENFKGRKIRKDVSDGDSDIESNFYIIKGAKCAAVLTENFFYDCKDDLKYLTSDEGVHAVTKTHVEGIIDFINSRKK